MEKLKVSNHSPSIFIHCYRSVISLRLGDLYHLLLTASDPSMIPALRREQLIDKSDTFGWKERNKSWTYKRGARGQHFEMEWSEWVLLAR